MPSCDVAIIGGGIVGLAGALALSERFPYLSVMVLEADRRLAAHQSGRNTGVIHSGVYCKPGSLMARHCLDGREALFRFCAEHGVPHERTGKIIVATRDEQLPGLQELEQRARLMGLKGARELEVGEIREYEPHVAAKAGLLVRDAGIVDFGHATRTMAKVVEQRGGMVRTGARVLAVHSRTQELVLETEHGEVHCRMLIASAGLQADRVARMCGINPKLQIVPFQTAFFELSAKPSPVRHLVYTVPAPGLPYLGLHLARSLAGRIEVVANPAIVHRRDGYVRWNFDLADTLRMWRYRGFWRMVFKHGKTSIRENRRYSSIGRLRREIESIVPEVRIEDLRWSRAGVHAQAVAPNGDPIHDLHVLEAPRMIHVLNAPSPSATSCLSIGRALAALAAKNLDRPRTVVAARTA
jgi:L-2-hydroxyglutarate oxidase